MSNLVAETSSATSPATESVSGSNRWEHLAAWAVVALAVAHLGLALLAVWPFTTDDAYITLRYARHLALGEGIRWNVGEAPLEGYSNPFSLFVAAAAILGGADPVLTLKVVGFGAALSSPILAFLVARRYVAPLVASFAAVPIAAHFGTAYWGVSGLETPIYLAMSLGSLLLWSSIQQRGLPLRHTAFLGVFTGLNCLVRPDAVLLAAAIGLGLFLNVLFVYRRDRRLVDVAKPLTVFALGILLT